MITTPYIGQRVKVSLDATYISISHLNNCQGRIHYIPSWGDYVYVILDGRERYGPYYLLKSMLVPVALTPEEQDQQQRKEHADKYL